MFVRRRVQDTEGGTHSPLRMFLVALVEAALLAATLVMTPLFAAKPANPGPKAGKGPPITAGPTADPGPPFQVVGQFCP